MSFRPPCAPLHCTVALHWSSLMDAGLSLRLSPLQPIRPPHVAQDETKNITNSTQRETKEVCRAQHRSAVQRSNDRGGQTEKGRSDVWRTGGRHEPRPKGQHKAAAEAEPRACVRRAHLKR